MFDKKEFKGERGSFVAPERAVAKIHGGMSCRRPMIRLCPADRFEDVCCRLVYGCKTAIKTKLKRT